LGVHLDPVNMISSPRRFYDNANFIRECFQKLGPHIKSCHAKDIALASRLTVHLDEVRPGLGNLDYSVFLSEANTLHPTPA
jgi:sugar phosphate isomerase/epimerase